MELDEVVTWEATHFNIKQRLTVKITKLDSPVYFEDQMIKGAFALMKHQHHFSESNNKTIMTDEFEFTSPLGFIGQIFEKIILTSYITTLLVKRNSKLKELAQSEEWSRYI